MPSVTFVDDGAPEMGLYDADGNIRVTVGDTSNSYGILARNGSFRGTLVDDDSAGVYAMDGSFNFYLIDGFAYFIGGLAKALINIPAEYITFSGAMVALELDDTSNYSTGATAFNWTQEIYNNGPWWSSSVNPSRFTAPTGFNGYVVLSVMFTVSSMDNVTAPFIDVRKNGSISFPFSTAYYTHQGFTQGLMTVTTAPIPLTEGQYLDVILRTGDVTTTVEGGQCWATIQPITIESGAGVTMSAPLLAQNLTGAGIFVPFDTEQYDIGGWHDNAVNNTRLSVPIDAPYDYVIISAGVDLASLGSLQPVLLSILKNGSTTFDGACQQVTYRDGVTNRICLTSGPIPVVKGTDYFEIGIFANDTSVDVTTNSTYFAIRSVDVESGVMLKKTNETGINLSTQTVLDWETEIYDIGGWFDPSAPTVITIPPGVSLAEFTCSIRHEAMTATEPWFLKMLQNGSETYTGFIARSSRHNLTTDSQSFSTGPIPVVAGQQYSIAVRINADTSTNLIGARCTFSARKIA